MIGFGNELGRRSPIGVVAASFCRGGTNSSKDVVGSRLSSKRPSWRAGSGRKGLCCRAVAAQDDTESSKRTRKTSRNGAENGASNGASNGAVSRRYHAFPKSEGLPLSLFTPYSDLPPEGKTLTNLEETCDPREKMCKTPAHVYEAECAMCNGVGEILSKIKGKGKKVPCTCMTCHGLGYVRRTTSRFTPEVNCVGPNLTINRPGLENGLSGGANGVPNYMGNGQHKKE
ncbi:hypothetical protein BSKO_09991 [Bryopsis sp. KO-2023]|nr:hypothetical protein BSKO_09991 [Bryopsis sp. KO-2023]